MKTKPVVIIDLVLLGLGTFLLTRSVIAVFEVDREFKELTNRENAFAFELDVSGPNEYEFILEDTSGPFLDWHRVLLRVPKRNITPEFARELISGLQGKLDIIGSNGSVIESAIFEKSPGRSYSIFEWEEGEMKFDKVDFTLVKWHDLKFPDQCLVRVVIGHGAPKLRGLSHSLVVDRRQDTAVIFRSWTDKYVTRGMAIFAVLIMACSCFHLLRLYRRNQRTLVPL